MSRSRGIRFLGVIESPVDWPTEFGIAAYESITILHFTIAESVNVYGQSEPWQIDIQRNCPPTPMRRTLAPTPHPSPIAGREPPLVLRGERIIVGARHLRDTNGGAGTLHSLVPLQRSSRLDDDPGRMLLCSILQSRELHIGSGMSFEHHQRLGYWCGRISSALRGRLEERTRELGLTCTAAVVLLALQRHGPATLVELAHLLEHAHPSVLRQIDVLEDSGFVTRVPHRHDRRMKIVQLTEKGKRILPSIHRAMRTLQAEALAGFSDRDTKQLMEQFRRIAANLGLHDWPEHPRHSAAHQGRRRSQAARDGKAK